MMQQQQPQHQLKMNGSVIQSRVFIHTLLRILTVRPASTLSERPADISTPHSPNMITITAGPLTTPFAQPSYCTSPFLSPADYSGSSIDYIVRDVTCDPGNVPNLAAACLPGHAVSSTSLLNWMEVVYSPAAACPIGHESVEQISSTVMCCPSSVTTDSGITLMPAYQYSMRRNYQITMYGDSRYCHSKPAYVSSSTIVFQCAGGRATPVSITILGEETFMPAVYSGSRTIVGNQMVYAMHIDLALDPSLPLTTFTATDQLDSSRRVPSSAMPRTTSGAADRSGMNGLSRGAIAGIVVGAVVLAASAVLLLVVYQRRKRRITNRPLPPEQPDDASKPELEGDVGMVLGNEQARQEELDATPSKGVHATTPVELPVEGEMVELPARGG
ncbi:hypothetical protein BCR34DRAFT_313706 [Clohesyomyces aquaticus]|uniref:Uncharacterized protein n=1 Tax=Clohesyomyces aquaticus TaxID=1231657 RepID=A0A1Y1ZNX7_9PLEO|nr:hypothetical protein BCR34DRAFT_313706 [Clohesyomyces aquaticus]